MAPFLEMGIWNIFLREFKKAQEFCGKQKVEWLNIVDLMRLSLVKGICTKDVVLQMINDIEGKEKTKIKRADEIFK